MRKWFACLAGLLAIALITRASWADSCDALSKQDSSAASISAAKSPGGSFKADDGAKAISGLSAFCRVAVTLRPTSDSEIHAEIWLPVSGWNGKFMAVGSGGWGGSIAYDGMADALRRGYATSATDDGHTGGSASFVVGHPEKFVDFAYRAEHEMTMEAKRLIKAYYGRDARYSYWNGCSGGGREGLLQAYRYPEEFDGVIAGDPANVRRNAWALWLANETFKDPAGYIPPEKYSMIHQFVLNTCDLKDGVKDGLIEDPERCHVDFNGLTCKASDGPDCLTTRQVKTAQTIVSPAMDAKGAVYFPRLEPGTELRWGRVAGGPEPAELFWDQFRYVVYQNPSWDWKSFDLERDSMKANAVDKDVDELDPNLGAFAKRGGKLLLYHGWADQQVAPGSSTDFYKAMIEASGTGARTSDWARLFMVPGMAHCSGGEGPDRFDKVDVMERWVEKGQAPEKIVASHATAGKVDRTRPLCPYPQLARYSGQGSIDDAANFSCKASQ
ncbi:tannase/feruloyl esterase family alpha/beta hydrolase [Granulicella sibirica]|uniref:Tannase n=1 Tax=Granulicella sibirica TaxID=2479048 RepID=A0A4Q0T6H6_9BACT|nr:tannase/feruloyl esterase family alpha/beta hydrolase [Granulicella sibirica]RXH57236.1 tannase precursor [Granulicella sibirica]